LGAIATGQLVRQCSWILAASWLMPKGHFDFIIKALLERR
jgi:hypothetical protein